MILLSNLLLAIAQILNMVFGLLLILVIARAILSWVSPDPFNPIVRFLTNSTEPFMAPLRRKFPFLCPNGMDFTPIALLFVIYFLKFFLVGSLFDYSRLIELKSM